LPDLTDPDPLYFTTVTGNKYDDDDDDDEGLINTAAAADLDGACELGRALRLRRRGR